jgi:hypothetical protein
MAYDRGQLEEFGLDRYADTLLAAQSMDWKELSEVEREAATKFCFFEEVWNRKALGTW